MKKKFLWLFASLLCIFALPSCSDDNDNDINPDKVPTTILTNFQAAYPDARGVEWEKKGNYYVADFTHNMTDLEVWYAASDGSLAMTEYDYGKDIYRIPGEVSRAFAEGEYGYWTVDDVKYYERRKADSFYIIEVEKSGERDKDLYYSATGTLIKAVDDSNVDITPDTVI